MNTRISCYALLLSFLSLWVRLLTHCGVCFCFVFRYPYKYMHVQNKRFFFKNTAKNYVYPLKVY